MRGSGGDTGTYGRKVRSGGSTPGSGPGAQTAGVRIDLRKGLNRGVFRDPSSGSHSHQGGPGALPEQLRKSVRADQPDAGRVNPKELVSVSPAIEQGHHAHRPS
jgi:hypothetical protein